MEKEKILAVLKSFHAHSREKVERYSKYGLEEHAEKARDRAAAYRLAISIIENPDELEELYSMLVEEV